MVHKNNSPNINYKKIQDLTNFEIPASNMLNAENTFQIYEQLRPILPKTKAIKSEIILCSIFLSDQKNEKNPMQIMY